MADTLLHVSVAVPVTPIGASFRVPARPDTTFEVVDTSSNVTVRVLLTDSAVNVEVERPADTLSIDTCLVVPRLKVEAPTDRFSRRRQIIFVVCFCFGCVTVWFVSIIILKIIK